MSAGLARGAFAANEFVTVVEKAASLPRAAANSFNVSRAAGALATRPSTALFTNAVVAIWVVFVPAVAVGAVGIPAKVAAPATYNFEFKETSPLTKRRCVNDTSALGLMPAPPTIALDGMDPAG